MPSYTTSLRLVLPTTGEYPGTWGTQVNDSLTALVDKAVAGTTSITMTAANYTLTNANGVADEAKSMFLVLDGTPGASFQVIVPTASKLYFVTNNTGFAQTVKTSAGTGISVPNGASMTLRCDATNVVIAQNYFASVTLGSALPVGSGGTGAATFTANNVLLGNGTSAFQVVAPGTVGNVLTSNGTTWQSSAPASSGVTTISFGSTGLTPSTATSGEVSVAGTLAAANGGTGLSSPGTAGNVLTSNGTTWTSSAPATNVQTFDSTGTWTAPTGGQSMMRIQIWGGGGGGSRSTTTNSSWGGGGGGYNEVICPMSYLTTGSTITIGGGGAGATVTGAGATGGTSQVTLNTAVNGRTLWQAFGGANAANISAGGGGPLGAGSSTGCGPVPGAPGGSFNGGNGTRGGAGQSGLYGAGGGTDGTQTVSLSLYGGAGGNAGTAAVQPGGGGGASTAANTNGNNGAAGRVIITCW